MSESVQEPTHPVPDPPGTVPEPAAPERVGSAGADRPALGWTEIGLTLVGILVLSAIAGVVLLFSGLSVDPYGFPSLIATYVAALLAIAGALAVRIRRPAALGIRATTWRWIALGAGAGLGMRVVAIGVILGYQALTGDVSNPQQSLTDSLSGTGWTLVGAVLVTVLLAPVTEELLLRGVLYGALRRYGVLIPLLVSSAAFGLLHGLNVVGVVTFLLGIVHALLYERSRSIWPAMISHAVFNASLFALVPLVT